MNHRNDILVFEYNSIHLPYKKSFLDLFRKNHSQRIRIYISTNPEFEQPFFYISGKNIESALKLDKNRYYFLKVKDKKNPSHYAIQTLDQAFLYELDNQLSCNNYNFALSGTNWQVACKLWGVFHNHLYNEDMEQPDYSKTLTVIDMTKKEN